MTVLMKNPWPFSSQSSPQGLVVPWQTTSKAWRVGWNRQIAPLSATRSRSGVPGRPTREVPWTPYRP